MGEIPKFEVDWRGKYKSWRRESEQEKIICAGIIFVSCIGRQGRQKEKKKLEKCGK